MVLSAEEIEWLERHRSAAMITIGDDGLPKVARVGVALVDGELWSSGTQDRVRTERLRRDPRCTLFVFDDSPAWITLETTVSILDGPDAPEQSLRLFRQMQDTPDGPLSWYGTELDDTEFVQKMADERRLIYRFEVQRSYGLR